VVSEWIDIIDTAVKIGLGSLIAAISGYVVLGQTQKYEDIKRVQKQQKDLENKRKDKYVDFLTLSHSLTYEYIYTSFSGDSEKYINYLKVYNEIQIISHDPIRTSAFNVLNSVNEYITMNKNTDRHQLLLSVRNKINDNIAVFQKLAQDEFLEKGGRKKE
jgi:hypothetical protein